ncbi:hypothetical protein, partial [Hydrogenophaga electricum]|uniref:hypothetical protein n=1 Tax=Hydrogenophaga electricum TaxID=1230953 RepID=UPI0024E055A5
LGLMAALVRRERQAATQRLDARIAGELQALTPAHRREQGWQALQQQATVLPQVAERLQTLMAQLDARSEQLDQRLSERQAQFHTEAASAYQGLAAAVAQTLTQSLEASARAAGESLRPVVSAAMDAIAADARQQHQHVSETVQARMAELTDRFGARAAAVADTWAASLDRQAQAEERRLQALGQTLDGFSSGFARQSAELLASVQATSHQALTAQASADAERQATWAQALQALAADWQGRWDAVGQQVQTQQEGVATLLQQTARDLAEQGQRQAAQSQSHLEQVTARTDALLQARTEAEARWADQHAHHTAELLTLWRTELGALRDAEQARSLAQAEQGQALQVGIAALLQQTARDLAEQGQRQAAQSQNHLEQVAARTDALLQARTEAEARWADQHAGHTAELLALWRTELGALRDAEQARSLAQAEQGQALQAAWTQQLAQLRAAEAERAEAQATRLATWQADAQAQLAALRSDEAARHEAVASAWTARQHELATQLAALRDEEAARGQAAVARLDQLQAAAARHLADLGSALEAPLQRLLHTASEVPQAAAEVIAQLKQEMSQLAERDNRTLAERATLVGQIGGLLDNVQQATGAQREAIESLVASAAEVFDRVGRQFADTVGDQAGRAEALTERVGRSTDELVTLGEAFREGARQMADSHETLAANLQRVEGAIQQSLARSDEQLAYYVAQAREVIDLSISAQQGIVEDLRRLRAPLSARAGAGEGAA